MSLVDILIFFLVIWWPIFFILLPIGYEPITNYDENTEFVRSAPKKPKILKKLLLASVISFFITLAMWTLEYYDLFSLKDTFV